MVRSRCQHDSAIAPDRGRAISQHVFQHGSLSLHCSKNNLKVVVELYWRKLQSIAVELARRQDEAAVRSQEVCVAHDERTCIVFHSIESSITLCFELSHLLLCLPLSLLLTSLQRSLTAQVVR